MHWLSEGAEAASSFLDWYHHYHAHHYGHYYGHHHWLPEEAAKAESEGASDSSMDKDADAAKKWFHAGGGGFYYHRGPFGGVRAGGFRYGHGGFGWLMQLGQPEADEKGGAEMLLVKADANGDGQLQLEEAMSLLSREEGDVSEDDAQEMKEAFADAAKKWYHHYYSHSVHYGHSYGHHYSHSVHYGHSYGYHPMHWLSEGAEAASSFLDWYHHYHAHHYGHSYGHHHWLPEEAAKAESEGASDS